jgi:nitrite reductase/ring-hydroxylating ferredoxin subunit
MTVMAGGKAVCLARYQGAFYALDDTCPHQGSSLGEGMIEDGYVVCPHHGWEFSPIDGCMPAYYNQPPTTIYPVEERGGEVYVGIETE